MIPAARLDQMKERAQAVQAVVKKIESLKEAMEYGVELTRNQGGQTIADIGLTEDQRAKFRQICEKAQLLLLDPPLRDHAGKIHTGFTVVDGGIAETGSFFLDSTKEDVRLATALVETHVAVVLASTIEADMWAMEKKIDAILKKDAPAYLAFITGASRTADIERVLAIGVHGPKELHILILDPAAPSA